MDDILDELYKLGVIISLAHEIVEQDYRKDTYVCIRCRYYSDNIQFDGQPCYPHIEKKTSGWRDCRALVRPSIYRNPLGVSSNG